jgi:hypothetical protein
MVLKTDLKNHKNCSADCTHEAEKFDIDAMRSVIVSFPKKQRDKDGTLASLMFDNRFIRDLPADPETINRPRQVPRACYSFVQPSRVTKPTLVAYSREVAELLDLSIETCESNDFLQVFAGNRLLPGMSPYATCYGGHQFGNWAGQLGDGRAINLGEIINQRSERRPHTLQTRSRRLGGVTFISARVFVQ